MFHRFDPSLPQTPDYSAEVPEEYRYLDVENDLPPPSLNSSARKRPRAACLPSLTIPMSPNFATSRRIKQSSDVLTSEELKLQELRDVQARFREERYKASLRKQNALYGVPMIPTRSTQTLTEPEEFSFATTSRFGPKTFTSDIPETPPSVKKFKLSENHSLSVTVPEPFQLSTSTRMKQRLDSSDTDTASNHSQSTPVSSPWVPLAERLRRIEKATPEYWKSRPRSPPHPLELTKPIEPLLQTALRTNVHPKPEPVASTQPSHVFKARPLNRRIFESSGDMGLLRIPKQPLTKPQSPKFHTSALRRPNLEEVRAKEIEALKEKRKFKALPVNATLPPPSVHTHAPAPIPLTVPYSPQLQTKARVSSRPDKPTQTPVRREFKAQPMPSMTPQSASKRRPYVPPKVTVPEPFDLATTERSLYEMQKRQEQIEAERKKQQEAKQFKARPIPVVEPFHPRLELKITEPEPFHLNSESAHYAALQQLKEKKEREEEERKRAAQFKARPMPSLDFKPVAHIAPKPLTDVSEFKLNTTDRSVQRAEFDSKKNEQNEQARLLAERRMALEAERQKAEIKRLRSTLVHKPVSIPKALYELPPPVRGSTQPLTEPKTPNFQTSKRIRMRN